MRRVGFGAGNFLARQLAGGDRIEALDALCTFAVGDGFHFKRVQLAELCNLLERQGSIVDKPDGGRLGHQQLLGHA